MRKMGKRLLAVLSVLVVLMTGCSKETITKEETVRSDVQAEAMIVLTNERNRYEKVYSDLVCSGRNQWDEF